MIFLLLFSLGVLVFLLLLLGWEGWKKNVPYALVALICIAQVVAIMSEDTFCLFKSINKWLLPDLVFYLFFGKKSLVAFFNWNQKEAKHIYT